MKIISHRGCLFGPDPTIENTPQTIEKAFDEGFDVEIDLRVNREGVYHLGHDSPDTQIRLSQLLAWTKKGTVYCHCKDLYTLTEFASKFYRAERLIPFFHDCDDAILLTNGTVWAHPKALREIKDNCWPGSTIAVVRGHPGYSRWKRFYAVCTDYPVDLARQLLKKEYTHGDS